MKSRPWFPFDLGALLSLPVVALGGVLLMAPVFSAINWLRHPTALAWLWTLVVATGTAILGAVLLFLAKLPQYRAGIFFHLGTRHLPPAQRRLYRVSFWLIVPSIVVLLALLMAMPRLR